jgi:hypothetical protein
MIVEKRRFFSVCRCGRIDRNAAEAFTSAEASQMEMYDAPEQFGVYGCISGDR